MATFDFPDNDYWLTNKRYVFKASEYDPLPIQHGTYLNLYGEDYVTNQSGTTLVFKGHKQDRDQWDGVKVFGFSLAASEAKDRFVLKNAGLWVHWDVRSIFLGGDDSLIINYGKKNFTDPKNHVGVTVQGRLGLGGGNDLIKAKAQYRGLEIGRSGWLTTGSGDDRVIVKSNNVYALAIGNVLDTDSGDDLIVGRANGKGDASSGIFLDFDAKLLTGKGNDIIKGNIDRRRSWHTFRVSITVLFKTPLPCPAPPLLPMETRMETLPK